ncbi:MAG TPA: hypothetical protein VI911_04900 [Patescibacteria group bacterium]|nr:hypothetical protein [Patescibacteria group bacterium]
MTKIIYKQGKKEVISKGKRYVEGKELELADYTESTAWSPWVKIKFIGESDIFFIESHKIDKKKLK